MSYPPQGSQGGSGAVTVAQTEVYSGVLGANLWRDLDLSSYIGAKASVVLLKVGCQNVASGLSIAFRRNGDTDQCYHTSWPGHGTAYGTAGKNNEFYFRVLVETDANGVIEVYTSAGVAITIDLLAYWN